MKKGLLVIMAMFMFVSTIEAKSNENTNNKIDYNTVKIQPIVFVENGIKFSVLPNGEFKFSKLNLNTLYSHRNPRFERNRSVAIVRNFKGQITQVGNVPIFYTRTGKVAQIGAIDLKYKHGKLQKVGNLHIINNPNGKVKYIGEVKSSSYKNLNKRIIIVS
ncbi:hypothetical protein [Lutibacter sp. B1]|uniref:hypothetical protein n=1 Tax=Lutibacter sp. B1 TaxID=2725996 RepID=UPI00145761F0|nr:hypothetical protein [Lutibacter sp. B1]NLP56685.1 hypothetical protein [Lutibacter sp. B1]